MNPVIYDLTYDFLQQEGHYLVFIEKNHRLLETEDLVPLQMKMIQSNVIPSFVPIIIEEMDFKIRLHYEITSKRMLSVLLKEKALSSAEFFSFILRIVDILLDSPLYLLDKNRYLLREDFIFIGKNLQEIYLTYLPLKAISGKGQIEEDLKDLLTHVASLSEGLEGREFQSILRYVKDSTFNLQGLKELLQDLQTSHVPSSAVSFEDSSVEAFDLPKMTPEPFQEIFHEPHPEKLSFIPTQEENIPKPEQDKGQGWSSREKLFMFSFVAIALAVIWKFYGDFPKQYAMDISSGLSLLVIVCTFVYWKFWRSGFRKGIQKDSVIEEVGNAPVFSESSPSFGEGESQPLLWDGFSPSYEDTNVEDYYRHLNENTTFLPQTDDTVLLENESPLPIWPYLIKEQEGQTERIDLAQSSFVIGRSPEASQYVLDSSSVSRTHLEILRLESGYGVKDLGSKNGSRLNEQTLVPYKMYTLSDQDSLTVGKVKFSFRTGA